MNSIPSLFPAILLCQSALQADSLLTHELIRKRELGFIEQLARAESAKDQVMRILLE